MMVIPGGGGGGGGLWGPGGVGGGSLRGGGRAGRAGLPFAGVPPELAEGVDRIAASEPAWPDPEAVFTHQHRGERPLSLRRILAPQRWRLVVISLVVVVETIALQAGPALTQLGIDRGIIDRQPSVLVGAALAAILAVVVTGVASGLRGALSGRLAARAMFELRVRVFGHLQRLSLDFYTREKAGVIHTRIVSDVEALQQLLQDGIAQFAIQLLTMGIVTGVLVYYNPRLAAITVLLILPPLLVLSAWFRRASDRGYLRVRDGIAGVLGDLAESLQGVRVVAGYNRQRRNIRQHRRILAEYRAANDYTARIAGFYGPTTEGIGLLGQAVLLLVGGTMVRRGELTIGELTAFVLYLSAFFQPIQQLVQTYNTYQSGKAAITKLRELLASEPTVTEQPGAPDLPPIVGAITFEGVSFGYDPQRPVLHDVDLTLHGGETVALVGPTGAGKSTVAKLVTRFYDPTRGTVSIDGHDLRTVSLTSLRRQLGVVPQEPFLFAGTIRDNITFARPDASDDEVETVVDLVGLSSLVAALPDGLDSLVHERGTSLSAGERQLVALARTFLARPRVVVLDEATSNLDLQSERKVEAALDLLLEGRTAIIVAHRLTTAMRADRVVLVEDGRIVEVGTHDQLVAADGRYASMFRTWAEHAHA